MTITAPRPDRLIAFLRQPLTFDPQPGMKVRIRPRARSTKSFDATIDPKRVKLCRMSEGGMLSRTRCLEQIPATIELAENGSAIEIFPDTPIPDTGTIGVYMLLFNPFNVGMYQFNALAQAPGDVPISGYLGSWLIQIDPPSN